MKILKTILFFIAIAVIRLKEFNRKLLYYPAVRLKIMQADYKATCTKNRQQYYVLKWYGWPEVFSARQIRNLRKKGVLNKQFTWLKLHEMCLYKTK